MFEVFIGVGHGGSDPGAVGNGMKEKDINLQIALANGAELQRHGIKVTYSRTKDENDPVTESVREANASKACVAIEHHINSASGKNGDGSETFYYEGSKDGKRLAELCEKYVKEEIGQNSRGAKPTKSLWFVKGTKMIAVLTESFFINNPVDAAIGDTLKEQQAFGKAYAKAILEYLKVPYKEDKNILTGQTVKVAYADKFNKNYAGTYKVVSKDGVLNMRADAGADHELIIPIASGEEVKCYGYYSETKSGTVWLLVQYNKYKGFMSIPYLMKV